MANWVKSVSVMPSIQMAGIRITTMLEQSVEVDMLIKSPTAAASGVEHK